MAKTNHGQKNDGHAVDGRVCLHSDDGHDCDHVNPDPKKKSKENLAFYLA